MGLLFLNLDQDAFALFPDSDNNPFVTLIAEHPGMVVEIIENTNIVDAGISTSMARHFTSRGVPLALDDIGAPDSVLAVDVLAHVDYLKLDRRWLTLHREPNHRQLLESLLDFARASGKKTILEGIETNEHRRLACELKVDYVQGYLYAERFIRTPVKSLARAA